jgi:RNA polymerase sigma-70 factor, ECF subfamily
MTDPESEARAVPDASAVGERVEQLAREFMEHRPRLLGIAYRMLGTMWDAEDIVADAMVRWLAVDREQVRQPQAFLTTMVTRRALDQLRSARVARERYIGEWLPEPVGAEPWPLDPLDTVERRESVSLATLRMMEQLTPPERAVFVLHEAFDVPHAAIAEALAISPDSSRQHLHRARVHLGGDDRRFDAEPAAHATLFEQFLAALEAGDLVPLQDALSSEAAAYSDGGGKARAARRAVVGIEPVLALFGALRRHHAIKIERRLEVNGQPGALLWFGGQYQLLTVSIRGDKIHEVHSIMNPDKLAYLGRQLAGGRRPG